MTEPEPFWVEIRANEHPAAEPVHPLIAGQRCAAVYYVQRLRGRRKRRWPLYRVLATINRVGDEFRPIITVWLKPSRARGWEPAGLPRELLAVGILDAFDCALRAPERETP